MSQNVISVDNHRLAKVHHAIGQLKALCRERKHYINEEIDMVSYVAVRSYDLLILDVGQHRQRFLSEKSASDYSYLLHQVIVNTMGNSPIFLN